MKTMSLVIVLLFSLTTFSKEYGDKNSSSNVHVVQKDSVRVETLNEGWTDASLFHNKLLSIEADGITIFTGYGNNINFLLHAKEIIEEQISSIDSDTVVVDLRYISINENSDGIANLYYNTSDRILSLSDFLLREQSLILDISKDQAGETYKEDKSQNQTK